VTAYRYGDSTC